ncbi:MAG: cysteine desulfurase [Bacteroidetes bacterium]|nr:cysteine desulfurase [Bacteroidota bacterium]
MKIYFDNAATTPLHPEVVEAMLPWMRENFGNPSSIHSFGRTTKSLIEQTRKKIADYLSVSPGEIFFTSCGTEANNTALVAGADSLGINHIISSPLEHHSVHRTLQFLGSGRRLRTSFVNVLPDGHIDLAQLEDLVKNNPGSMVSLMHGNNEIGNLLDIRAVSDICSRHNAIFHSDMVQTVGHFPVDLKKVKIDFISCSAHKFHGPKGTGFLYISGKRKIAPLLYGGSQEMNMRAGTENVAGIAGMGKALEIAYNNLENDKQYISDLKNYMAQKLSEAIPGIRFNGDCLGRSLYTVLNVAFPLTENSQLLLYNLDIWGIAASGGSACASGSVSQSHVLSALYPEDKLVSIRFSFSKYNTIQEVDYCLEKLKGFF